MDVPSGLDGEELRARHEQHVVTEDLPWLRTEEGRM